VIVVNTNPMELFCMAGEKEAKISEYGCSQNDLPPSVLVTGDDGDWLLDLFDFEYVDKSTIMVEASERDGILPFASHGHYHHTHLTHINVSLFSFSG